MGYMDTSHGDNSGTAVESSEPWHSCSSIGKRMTRHWSGAPTEVPGQSVCQSVRQFWCCYTVSAVEWGTQHAPFVAGQSGTTATAPAPRIGALRSVVALASSEEKARMVCETFGELENCAPGIVGAFTSLDGWSSVGHLLMSVRLPGPPLSSRGMSYMSVEPPFRRLTVSRRVFGSGPLSRDTPAWCAPRQRGAAAPVGPEQEPKDGRAAAAAAPAQSQCVRAASTCRPPAQAPEPHRTIDILLRPAQGAEQLCCCCTIKAAVPANRPQLNVGRLIRQAAGRTVL